MSDQNFELGSDMTISAEEIDEVISQFRLRTSDRRLSPQQMQKFFNELPKLTEAELTASGHHDGVCPICLTKLLAILEEEEFAHAMGSPAHPVEELGVTKLQKTLMQYVDMTPSITKWIMEGHDSCPSCRRPFLTDTERQENAPLSPPPVQGPSDDWLREWIVGSNMVARDPGLPAQLPILPLNSTIALGTRAAGRERTNDRRDERDDFSSMYS
ncbi:hypothetical protein HYDPIDRAFT_23160 [Hydnomerulius pinastri MD-312]|nr:hypothetical protein HYDPIDRAFT_23160 [Hydnomerulius pinastri MD-312]